jgi:AraC-like DNA-binding protein
MRYWRLRPDARLAPWIKCYWWVESVKMYATAAPVEPPDLLIPDGHSEIVFHVAGEFSRWQLGEPEKRASMSHSYVIGGRSKSVLTHSPGGLRLAGVKLDPRALRVLLRRPLADFRDNTVACADLGCRALLDLEDEIASLGSVERLQKVFDRFFLRRLDDHIRDDAATELLLRRIRATRGAQPILEWVREQRLDARTLERRFVARVGMTPKRFARVERFKHAYRLLGAYRPGARRAHLDAYYDESHFDREFRGFMGTSPASWLSRKAGFTTIIGDHLLEFPD